jgi:hypothetical protein
VLLRRSALGELGALPLMDELRQGQWHGLV